MVGQAHQHPARRTPLHVRLHSRVVGDFTPHCDKRVPETAAGEIPPFLAQISRRLIPGSMNRPQCIFGTPPLPTVAARLSSSHV